jgi:hypothetical protein
MACRVVWCKNAADAWGERNDGIGEMSVHVEAQLAGKTLFLRNEKKGVLVKFTKELHKWPERTMITGLFWRESSGSAMAMQETITVHCNSQRAKRTPTSTQEYI